MLMYALFFAAGYLLRHFDILRFHVPANPLLSAINSVRQTTVSKAEADLLAKIQGAAPAAAPASGPAST